MTNPQNKKALNLDVISRRNQRMNRGDFSENKNNEIMKLRMKLNHIMILKRN